MDKLQKMVWQFLPFAILIFFVVIAVFSNGAFRTMTLFIVFGGLLGWLRATRKGGNLLDKYQWAGVHALMLMLVGFILSIVAS